MTLAHIHTVSSEGTNWYWPRQVMRRSTLTLDNLTRGGCTDLANGKSELVLLGGQRKTEPAGVVREYLLLHQRQRHLLLCIEGDQHIRFGFHHLHVHKNIANYYEQR